MIKIGALAMVKTIRTGLPTDHPGIVISHNPSDTRPWLVQLVEAGKGVSGRCYWCHKMHLVPDPINDPPDWTLPDLTAKQRATAIIQNKALLHSAPQDASFLLVAIIEAIEAATAEKGEPEP